MIATIIISEIRTHAKIGVFPKEITFAQPIRVSVEMGVDIARSVASDNLQDSVDYDAVTAKVHEITTAEHTHLIEALSHRIATEILTHFPIHWVKVTLVKPKAIPTATDVRIIVEKHRSETR